MHWEICPVTCTGMVVPLMRYIRPGGGWLFYLQARPVLQLQGLPNFFGRVRCYLKRFWIALKALGTHYTPEAHPELIV
jgi:hypothetical protein